jgi:hypothetical protein
MANEATLYIETDNAVEFTCADGTGIERGTILKLADPMTVSAAAGLNDIVGGIAATEKIASDGKTKIAVYRGGYFKVTASGSITVGDSLVISGPTANNLLQTAATNAEQIIGIAMETATDGQTFIMQLNPTTMQLA